LQHKKVEALAKELGLPVGQLLALFNKSIRKLSRHLRRLCEEQAGREMAPELAAARAGERRAAARAAAASAEGGAALAASHEDEQSAAGAAVLGAATGLEAKQQAMLDQLDLGKYQVGGSDAAWDTALAGSRAVKGGKAPATLSVQRDAADGGAGGPDGARKKKKKKSKHRDGGGGSGKKRKKVRR